MINQTYAPGMRVEIRDEEWVIRKVENNSRGRKTIYATGLSGIVSEKEGIFLEELEDISIIDPADTDIVFDDSEYFRRTKLYMESKLRKKVPSDAALHTGYKAAMNLVDFQLEPAYSALQKPRQRILIADGVGLGKTLEAGILVSELMARSKGKRILVLAVKSMMLQFQKEFWSRFAIPLKRLDSKRIQRIRSEIPSNHNPFYYYDKTIISIDTLKRDIEYRTYLENTKWDIIIIDEAHNVANRGKKRAQRSKLAELLSRRSDTLIMLSATPHDGKPESFASLMNMLDPTAIANEQDYSKEDIKGMVFRRFKKDVQDQVRENFRERRIYKERSRATAEEEKIFDLFTQMEFTSLDKRRTRGKLFKTTLEKSLFSSPAACIKTVINRIKRLDQRDRSLDPLADQGTCPSDPADPERDITVLQRLKEKLEKIPKENFSKYQKLLDIIKSNDYDWRMADKDDRLVIFTERIETMHFLKKELTEDLNLKENEIIEIHGGLSDVEQQTIVDEFGATDSDIKILVATDVASEGINLHYLSHRVIHFDLPWSLMVFQQRNGRIDRYGQERNPDIRYILTETENSKIKGDLRILEILIEKEEQAEKNIGDPATIMKKYDIEAEEEQTSRAIEENLSADEFSGQLEEDEEDPFLKMMQEGFHEEETEGVELNEEKTIYTDIEYIEEGLKEINAQSQNAMECRRSEADRGLRIKMNKDLEESLKQKTPEEAFPAASVLRLTTDRERIEKEIKDGRQKTEDTWPDYQYLWPLHPIIEWMNDKADILYNRRQTPLIRYEELKPGEHIFIASALLPNKRGTPVIDKWYGIRFEDSEIQEVLDLETLLDMSILNRQYPNANRESPELIEEIKALLPKAVRKTKELMKQEEEAFEEREYDKLEEQLKALEELKEKHREQIALFQQIDNSNRTEAKANEKRRKIDEIFDEYFEWIRETMMLEKDNPYIELIAVLSGGNRFQLKSRTTLQ